MSIVFPYTFANLSGNVPASDLDACFTYTTTLAANATVASSLTGSELILISQGGSPFSATITQIASAVGVGTATQANQLTTGRTIAMTGDVTWTSPTFNGTANITATSTVISASTSTAGKVQLAQASDVAAGTSTTLAVTPASLSGLSSGIKAWVRFAGSSTNGNMSILASFNVGSVVRTSGGHYTINFTSALTDANFAWSGSAKPASGNDIMTVSEAESSTNTSGSLYISIASSNTTEDPAYCSIMVIR